MLNDEFTPVQLNVGESPEEVQQYDVVWTPTLLVFDDREKAQYRFEGFLPPEEDAPMALAGKALTLFRRRRFSQARDLYFRIHRDYPATKFTPEVLYYLAAAQMYSGDREGGMATWRQLQRDYPDGLWALRVPLREPGRAAA